MRFLTLTPLDARPKTYDFVAFDTEGDGSRGGFICAAAYDASGGHFFTKRSHLRDYLFSRGNLQKKIVAANLEYDWATAFQPFDYHHSILLDNGRWLRASYQDNDKHAWVAWDIQRIAPLTVAEMGQIVGLEKYPMPKTLRGNHAILHDALYCPTHHRPDCIPCYCLRDAEIVYKFTCAYQAILNGLGGQMKLTAASCAMDLFRRRFLQFEIAATFPEKNDAARRAYYGGRVETFKVGTARDIHAYDVNSLYPAVMRDAEVGLPSSYHHLTHTARLYQRLEGFGQWSGTIEIPDSYVPSLPVRKGPHCYYPTGLLHGTWTFSEIRHALSNGARIKDTDDLVFASQTVKPFTQFVDTLFRVRSELKARNDPQAKIVKLLLNSLYGKFGQRGTSDLQTLLVPRGKIDLRNYTGCTPAELGGYEVLLKPILPDLQSPHVHVLWAAEIAARARMVLAGQLCAAGSDLFYCDTDSIHTAGALPTGAGLGDLKLETDYAKVTYLAPKEYGGVNQAGQFVSRVKGIPPDHAQAYLEKGSAEFEQPIHILTAMQTGKRIATWSRVVKARRAHPPVRDHKALADYNRGLEDTRPYPADGLPEPG